MINKYSIEIGFLCLRPLQNINLYEVFINQKGVWHALTNGKWGSKTKQKKENILLEKARAWTHPYDLSGEKKHAI